MGGAILLGAAATLAIGQSAPQPSTHPTVEGFALGKVFTFL